MKLLLAEDEKELARALQAILAHAEYKVDVVHDGQTALEQGLANYYDGIILDVMMPGMNGFAVLKQLRQQCITTPVLMLTAKSEVGDRIEGLDLGADDYLAKPFDIGELLARIRAMVRRQTALSPDILTAGRITLDVASGELTNGTMALHLSSKELQLCTLLLQNEERCLSTEQLLEHLWRNEDNGTEEALQLQVSFLNKKFEVLQADLRIVCQAPTGYCLEVST